MTYPMPAAAARARRRDLERELRQIDAQLAENPTAELDRHRERVGREFDELHEALESLDESRQMPVCVCGKIAHADREGARRQLRSLRVVAANPDPRREVPLRTYRCRLSNTWHVGHRARGRRATRRGTRSPAKQAALRSRLASIGTGEPEGAL